MAQFSWPPVSVSTTGLAQDTSVQTLITEVGTTSDTAPASDTATASLNGRLQRIAQRLTSLIGLLPASLGQKTMAGSLSVTLASDEAALPVTGAFYQATQPISGSVSVSNLPTTQAVSGTFWQATQPVSGTFWQATQPVSLSTLPALAAGANAIGTVGVTALPALPTGANTIGNIGSVATVSAVTAITNALPAGTNVLGFTKQGGRAQAFPPVYNAYSTVQVLTSAYVQLVASTSTAVTYLDIFDSSGQAMIIATGAAGSEVIQAYVPPGGDQIAITIAAGTRIAIKALTGTASSGFLLLNGWN